MSCAEVRDAYLRGERPEGSVLEQHLVECETCRELSASDLLGPLLAASSSGAPTFDPALAARVAADLERETGFRARLRALPTWLRVAVAVSAGLALALIQGALLPSPGEASSIPALSALLVLTIAVLLSSARAFRTWQKRGVLLLAVGLPVVLALLPIGGQASFAGVGNAMFCLGYGAAFSVPLLVLLTLLERRERLPGIDVALCGAALGLAGALVLDLHCGNSHPYHLLAGHASIGWVMIVAGLAWKRLGPKRPR